MKDWLFGGILGLLLGWTLQRCGLPRPCDVQRLLSLRQPRQTRTLITALGFTIVLAAGLGWLAVLDVDHFRVLPLHGGTILGALLMARRFALCWADLRRRYAARGWLSPYKRSSACSRPWREPFSARR